MKKRAKEKKTVKNSYLPYLLPSMRHIRILLHNRSLEKKHSPPPHETRMHSWVVSLNLNAWHCTRYGFADDPKSLHFLDSPVREFYYAEIQGLQGFFFPKTIDCIA